MLLELTESVSLIFESCCFDANIDYWNNQMSRVRFQYPVKFKSTIKYFNCLWTQSVAQTSEGDLQCDL